MRLSTWVLKVEPLCVTAESPYAGIVLAAETVVSYNVGLLILKTFEQQTGLGGGAELALGWSPSFLTV